MKRFVCIILALVLCASAAVAESWSVPSKSTLDMTHFEVVAEKQPGDENIFLLPVNDVTVVEENKVFYQERIDVCEKEIQKLAASETVESYFGEVKDAEGNVVDIKEKLGVEKEAVLDVFEFCPAVAGGFKEDCGKVTAKMRFSTPYKKEEKVLVMIGIVTVLDDGTQVVDWQMFEGFGLGEIEDEEENFGAIQVELTPEIVAAIQNGMALMAVVSAEDAAEMMAETGAEDVAEATEAAE